MGLFIFIERDLDMISIGLQAHTQCAQCVVGTDQQQECSEQGGIG